MKKIYASLILIFIVPVCLLPQSNFDPEQYQQYRQQIKDMSASQLLEKYPAQNLYYSSRLNKTSPEDFQYLDSIDLRYNLTGYEKELIADNHFMVSERLSHRSFSNAFIDIYSSDLPLFLSTDFFLHALHVSYDAMLRDLEVGLLEPNLSVLLYAMRDLIPKTYYKNDSSPDALQAIKDADLFISMALSLLHAKEIKPLYDNSGSYATVLDAIVNLQPPVLEIGLFSEHTRKLDISQFTPRGHYTEQFWWNGEYRDLKNYFKAMMWLGRVDFMLTAPPVAPGEPEWTTEDLQRMSRGAMILNQLLNDSGKKNLFTLHEKIINFFVGPDDNLNPDELQGIITELGITQDNLAKTSTWEAFVMKLNESDDYGQKIMSNFFIVDADKENPGELPISFRLLGQKFLIDSYVFSEVVYDRVYHEGKEVLRMMPDPLDAMFVLGNDNTLPLLEEELNTYHYAYKLEELRYLTEAYDTDFRQQSLYNSWLGAIRELNPPADHTGLPYFMQTTEWQLEKLNTQLSSWAELRHDNVLYAKQSYTGGTSCSFPYVYVEPYPGFYKKLAQFCHSAKDFFTNELSGVDVYRKQDLISFYQNFAIHMGKLKLLAEKELRLENFNDSDLSYLKTFINGYMASGPSITGWYNELFYDPWKSMEEDYLVVDVHTQPTDEYGNVIGKIMHVGTGDINLGVFCAGSPCNNYHAAAFVGPVMSFHTQNELNWKRLTDNEWAEYFGWDSKKQPERPDWVNHYLAGKDGQQRGTGLERNLKGYTFQGTGLNPPLAGQNIAYLLAFPNPVSESGFIRFVLNHPTSVTAEIYDVLGKRMNVLFQQRFPSGEHHMNFSVDNFRSGLYFLRLTTEKDQAAIRLRVE
ncbi:MAG: DUF3160 domain-containing protein [Bacteroidales bacterium]|nr:DUF3160 domain-containing protein [Bacteroidales bacterium]